MPKKLTTSHSQKGSPRRRGRDRRIRIRSELRDQPDLQKIASTVVALALAQAEKEAQSEQAAEDTSPSDVTTPDQPAAAPSTRVDEPESRR